MNRKIRPPAEQKSTFFIFSDNHGQKLLTFWRISAFFGIYRSSENTDLRPLNWFNRIFRFGWGWLASRLYFQWFWNIFGLLAPEIQTLIVYCQEMKLRVETLYIEPLYLRYQFTCGIEISRNFPICVKYYVHDCLRKEKIQNSELSALENYPKPPKMGKITHF